MKHMYHFSASQIAINYGIFAGKAVVIANIPIAISSAMSSAVIPSISGAFARGDQEKAKQQIATAVKVTMMISIPCAIGLAALAEPVTRLLFPQKVSLQLASDLLRSICVTVVFYALSTLTNAVLQAIGKVNTPVRHAAAALIIQTIVLVVLLCFTNFGVQALAALGHRKLCFQFGIISRKLYILQGCQLPGNIQCDRAIQVAMQVNVWNVFHLSTSKTSIA